MKLLQVCFILSFLFCSCNNRSNEKIIQVFQPRQTYKSITTKSFGWGKGFCGGSIWLNSDSTYTEEYGCEGRSRLVVGNWYIIGDSIELKPIKGNLNNISFNVSLGKAFEDSVVTFIITDKVNSPIENFVIQPLNKKPKYMYSDEGLLFIRDEKYSTDSLGTLKIKKDKADSLYFPKLFAFTNKTFSISTDHLPDTIKIGININGVAFYHDQLKYSDSQKSFRCRYINGKLIFKE